jgi:hypothetical protein
MKAFQGFERRVVAPREGIKGQGVLIEGGQCPFRRSWSSPVHQAASKAAWSAYKTYRGEASHQKGTTLGHATHDKRSGGAPGVEASLPMSLHAFCSALSRLLQVTRTTTSASSSGHLFPILSPPGPVSDPVSVVDVSSGTENTDIETVQAVASM